MSTTVPYRSFESILLQLDPFIEQKRIHKYLQQSIVNYYAQVQRNPGEDLEEIHKVLPNLSQKITDWYLISTEELLDTPLLNRKKDARFGEISAFCKIALSSAPFKELAAAHQVRTNEQLGLTLPRTFGTSRMQKAAEIAFIISQFHLTPQIDTLFNTIADFDTGLATDVLWCFAAHPDSATKYSIGLLNSWCNDLTYSILRKIPVESIAPLFNQMYEYGLSTNTPLSMDAETKRQAPDLFQDRRPAEEHEFIFPKNTPFARDLGTVRFSFLFSLLTKYDNAHSKISFEAPSNPLTPMLHTHPDLIDHFGTSSRRFSLLINRALDDKSGKKLLFCIKNSHLAHVSDPGHADIVERIAHDPQLQAVYDTWVSQTEAQDLTGILIAIDSATPPRANSGPRL